MNLSELIKKEEWTEIILHFTPEKVAKSLSISEGISVAHILRHVNFFDDELRDFAISILEAIRVFHFDEWERSWKYDAFLGSSYRYVMRHEDAFAAFEASLKKAWPNPHSGLLVALAGCLRLPGGVSIEYMRSLWYLKCAIKDYLYKDAVLLLRRVYRIKGDKEKAEYWAWFKSR